MKNQYFLFLFLTGILLSLPFKSSISQEKATKEVYPYTHHMSAEEKARFHLVGKDYVATDPPPGEIRNIAEFDQMEGVLVAYPNNFGISYDLIAAMSEETMVTTVVRTSNAQNYVTNQYQSHGVNMDNVNFLVKDVDSYWTRDYGPWYVAYGDDQIGIVDFIYNRPDRVNDNAIPSNMADFLGIDWFGMDLITAGGNYMTTGQDISSSSDLIWEENPSLSQNDIDQMVLDYLGVSEYFVLDDPNNTYIDHIDCWGKFLDVDKVLIREVPTSHPQYDEIEATANFYAEQISPWGNYFEIYRVWTPNNQPYTNSLILNDRVFVPITGSQWDDEALAAYEEAMPGYEILGLTGSWESTDALHCRTKGIADRNMLYIEHMPLLGDQPIQTEYEIEVKIIAYSSELIIDNEVKVIYQINGGTPVELVMTSEGDDIYSASLPGDVNGSNIAYYITASDEEGNMANHPFIGEYDPHVFYVGEQLFPAIALDVTEINTWVNEGYVDVEEFSVSNSGGLELNYSIEWNSNIYENHEYDVEDSPNAGAWDFNTYDELGWTEFDMTAETGEIANWQIDFSWQTDNWPEEGTFLIQSPVGTEAIIAAGIYNGNYTMNLDDFNGEEIEGTWRLWITDSYGDGGHQATNIQITVTNGYEIYPWLTVDPTAGSIEPGGSNSIEVTCDGTTLPVGDYEGLITVSSNDPDFSTIEIPVYFTVDIASGLSNQNDDVIITNYPNPFSYQTNFRLNLSSDQEVELSIYDMNGRLINTLIHQQLIAGSHSIGWQGENANGEKIKSGIYFYRLSTEGNEITRKIILMD